MCWGSNGNGQTTVPPSVNGTTGTATALSLGYGHSCAVQAETARVVCWGLNDPPYGHGEATPPPEVDGTDGTASALSAGAYHSCAIQAETGRVFCWGYDLAGQATPPPSVDGTDGTATAIGVGSYHTLAVVTPEADSLPLGASAWAALCWIAGRRRTRRTGFVSYAGASRR